MLLGEEVISLKRVKLIPSVNTILSSNLGNSYDGEDWLEIRISCRRMPEPGTEGAKKRKWVNDRPDEEFFECAPALKCRRSNIIRLAEIVAEDVEEDRTKGLDVQV